ncbi:phosphotransferase [Ruegeria sp. R13_0]|uniref:phosphotransferase n=1 Tax=Ruegeria sp. R13_0 TaxID=2821099 RepID=UPI001AD9DDBB|nr:phosphotransferase [Ruegeria sp. R13_0]MBO9436863.1 phosphotransferase [Ruegeria sp. R13_0]
MMNSDLPLLNAVRYSVGDPDANILSWNRRALGEGFADAMAGGEGLILHSGTLAVDGGERAYELVEKVCRVMPPGREPGSWLYWKREAQVYASGLLDGPFSGVRAPDCYGVTYTNEPSARVFIEAISDAQPNWTAETYVRAAHALGSFSASAAGIPDIERHDWMAVGRAHSWIEIAADILNDPDILKDDLVLKRWLTGSNLSRTRDLWSNIGVLKAALADLPKCFCHHDAFNRNLLFRETSEGEPEIIAIDWAFAGYGNVGEELAAAVGASLMFMDTESDDAGALTERMFSGYLDGLRAENWSGASGDVRLSFCATTAMMFALGAIGPWLPLLSDPELEPVVRSITGAEPDQFIGNLSKIQEHFLNLGEEAVALAGG